jgi:hypothetical protein
MEQNPSEPMLVAELGRQLLGVAKMTKLRVRLSQGVERDARLEVKVDLLLQSLRGLRQMRGYGQRFLERRRGRTIGRPTERLGARLTEVGDRLLPHLAPDGVVREPLDLLAQAIGCEPLDHIDEPGMQGAAVLLEDAPIGNLLGEGGA